MSLPAAAPGGPYSPLTKSIDLEEAQLLIGLSLEFPDQAAWQEEALYRLPQASRQRRQEVARDIRRKFLPAEAGRFVDTPLRALVAGPTVDARLKRDLLLAQYLRATPLVWEAVRAIVLPHAEAGAQNGGGSEILTPEWAGFLSARLNTTTPSTVEKTRNHITAHLVKFGLLEAQPLPGDAIAKRFLARFYQPDPRAFLFSLAVEFGQNGWTSRSESFICQESWTRIAYCASPAFAHFALEEAERYGLAASDYFGSEKQITLRGPDPVQRVVEVVSRNA